jgi:Tol biopolymer transport system component
VPFSYRRSFDPLQNCALIDSKRGDGQHRQLYQQPILPYGFSGEFANTCLPERLTYTDSNPTPPTIPATDAQLQNANDYNPSMSPDGAKVAFVSDRYGRAELYLTRAEGSTPARLTTDGCFHQHPSWSPDGRQLYWERQCADGMFRIVRGDLKYDEDGSQGMYASLVNVRELTGQEANNNWPRVSPDGTSVVFTSYRDGNAEVYIMDVNGANQRRLTNNAAADEAATWSSDGRQLAFASNRDGDYDIYVMNTDGSGQSALTSNSAEDRWPSWAQ